MINLILKSKIINYHRNIKKQNEIKEKIKSKKNQIISIIIKLQNISRKLEGIAINNNLLKIELEYLDSLIDIIDIGGIGLNYKKLKNKLKMLKENINCLEKSINLKKMKW